MTKSELVDQVADRADLTKQDAARAVDAVLATVEDALRRGSEVTVSGFGKFHVGERGARQGVNPRTGERIQIAASRVPRFTAGSGLKSAVRRAADPGLRQTPSRRACEERESQIVLGLDPDPSALWPARRRARAGHVGGALARGARRERGGRSLQGADRRDGGGVRGDEAPARLLRAAGRAGLERARGGRRARARGAGCS